MSIKKIVFYLFSATLLFSCSAKKNYPGVEFAPQMYHSVPYEPLSQITESSLPKGIISSRYYIPNSLPYNDFQGKKMMNMRLPVPGTIARRRNGIFKNDSTNIENLLIYNLHKDSVELAGRILKNPITPTEEILEEGKSLYLSFCSPCHGALGGGDGKVGAVYQGVANFQGRAYSNLPPGHIFHVITHGRNRMWAHKSQLSPIERWKIVLYVQKLQKGES